MKNRLNILIDGKRTEGSSSDTILQLANRLGISIPTLCYDPRLEPYSSCYVCVVEVEGMRNMQPACSTLISDGMVVNTNNEAVRKARKAALELLASNHYADCLGPCRQTCPAGVDVQGYISMIEKGLYSEAIAIIKETNPFPAVCGRVCVRPCEVACRRNLLDEGTAVGIDYLKRFAADRDLDSHQTYMPSVKPSSGKSVAIIGAGPAGLSAAFFLRKEGHAVTVYESAPKAGGWLRYGIPEYRLPNNLLQQEIDRITDMGVKINYNAHLGKNISYGNLRNQFDSVILAVGSQKGTRVGCEGDEAGNVLSGIDFLRQMELTGQRMDFTGKTVAVVGGGNTAMDCCRTAIRCGAKKVYIIYRRTEAEMPANPIEIHESKLEGVEYLFLTNPKRINKDEKGNLRSVICLKMELGEADASGRRRPVPVEGSEFDIELDFVLAAVGQKTDVDFLNDINDNSENGKLVVNKWGDIDACKHTLQTGIPSVFAAGDGVTGPATLIQAIAQGKIAAHSCHQHLSGLAIVPVQAEFISKKENFKEQKPEEYSGRFTRVLRHEMPVLPAEERMNFSEVELGYEKDTFAQTESNRCLECGCTEYFDCDLKRLCTDYGADQKRFNGEFREYQVDFRHPYIEIDNNKCILCSSCIRICDQIVGASALGLINRGFDTYIAPAMELPLHKTTCESCGMCISACPTGAITENVPFKPGPVQTGEATTICSFCSVGCSIVLNHRNGFVMKVSGGKGIVNQEGNLCRYPKFGYRFINDPKRITTPLIRNNGGFEPIEFEQAYNLIAQKIKEVEPDENIFFAGARLTNEEMYLLQKLARAGAGTNNITSFHYHGRGTGYAFDNRQNVPFAQLQGASRFILMGSEINRQHAVAGFMLNVARNRNGATIEVITEKDGTEMDRKANKVLKISSYYHFLKAVNHYLLSMNLENATFIKQCCSGFDEYKEAILQHSFMELVMLAGVDDEDQLKKWAVDFNNDGNAVVIFAEAELSSRSVEELFHLAMITGKPGSTAGGLLALKEKNNSQGLFDTGVHPKFGPGAMPMIDETYRQNLAAVWGKPDLPHSHRCSFKQFCNDIYHNIFIFGEDPIGCAINSTYTLNSLEKANFRVVQDYFMTPTALMADLILPATLAAETGGSFTNTQGMIQQFSESMPRKVVQDSWQQISGIMKHFGLYALNSPASVLDEMFGILQFATHARTYHFRVTEKDNFNRMFNHGCDAANRRFDLEFAQIIR